MAILTATDFSERSRTAIRTAARLAAERDSSLTLLHCLEMGVDDPSWRPEIPDQMRREYRQAGTERLREFFAATVPDASRPANVEYRVEFAHPAEGITRLGEEGEFEWIVVGSTGRNRLANALLGSTTEEIVRRSTVPVLVVPEAASAEPYRRIVAPVDFSPCSRASLEAAANLARASRAELYVVHALPLPMVDAPVFPTSPPANWTTNFEREREAAFDRFVAEADLEGVEWTGLRESGWPADVIEDAVEEVDADLVVMGTHGRRGLERFFIGSTATKILRRLSLPVLTIRAREDDTNDLDSRGESSD